MTVNRHSAELASLRLYEAESSVETVAARHGLDPASVVDFSLNVNPFGPPPGAVAAAREALGRANLYPDLHYGALRRALAGRHGVPEDALFFGAGLDDVIKLLLQAWTSEGDRVLVHLPTFPRYELEARLRGCRVVAVESDPPWSVDAGRLAEALRREEIALAFLCTPNNPTGAVVAGDDVAALADAFPETLFLVDEALIDPAKDGAVPLVGSHRNVAVMRTFSKYLGIAGLRVGYAVAPPDLVRVAEIGRPPFNVPAPAIAAAVAALADGPFLDECRAMFRAETERAVETLAAAPGIAVRGQNANMMLLELARGSAADLSERLAARGLLVADATSFRGLEHVQSIRVSLRSPAENDRLFAALTGSGAGA